MKVADHASTKERLAAAGDGGAIEWAKRTINECGRFDDAAWLYLQFRGDVDLPATGRTNKIGEGVCLQVRRHVIVEGDVR
jgi:hypothetical protein